MEILLNCMNSIWNKEYLHILELKDLLLIFNFI